MTTLTRTDTSLISRWWWTVDRWNLLALLLLIAIGILLTLAAGPPAAERINLPSFNYVQLQFMMLPLAIALMLGVSLLSPACASFDQYADFEARGAAFAAAVAALASGACR